MAGVGAWALGSGVTWLIGALLLGAVIPFTLLIIKPVNDRLLASDLDPHSAEIPVLLARWGTLHWVRSVAGVVSFLCWVVAGATD
jgi:hypothetical protein